MFLNPGYTNTLQSIFYADLESYGPEVHGKLGRRFDSPCHGLQTKRQFVALVGFVFAEMLAECRTDRVCRKGGVRTTGASLAAPIST